MTKTLIIVNPNSGSGRCAKTWPLIQAALDEKNFAYDFVLTAAPLQAIQFAQNAKRDGYENVISIGGDGTTNEVVNGLMQSAGDGIAGTFGVIPIGSGNDFAKMFPAPRQPGAPQPNWQDAIQHILENKIRLLDVCHVTATRGKESKARYFVNALDTGFAAQANKHAHDYPQLTGTMMYLAAIFKTMINFSIDDLTVQLDDRTIAQTTTLAAISNGRCIGGGFWMAPNSLPDDGLIDVTVADGLGRIGILSLIPRVMNGTHITDPRIKTARSSRAIITGKKLIDFETDGEIWFEGAERLEIQVLHHRLRTIG